MQVVIARTGTANVASVAAALGRLGAEPRMTQDATEIEGAAMVVLPGVGTLAAAMQAVRACGMAEALARRVECGRPTLAICLGLQMLCEGSQESPGVPGLGIVPGVATRFREGLVVPQLGWNSVSAGPGEGMLEDGWAYFANSYKLDEVPRGGWRGATADHGGRFVAAMERGAVLACQFHPELSGSWGLQLIGRWIEEGRRCSR